MSVIYLDHQATTPLDDRVLEAMLPYLRGDFGNPSSIHEPGRRAAAAVLTARERLAELLGCNLQEVVFTSGATEANNLALKGLAHAAGTRRHLVTCVTEHPSVLEPLRRLARNGFELTEIGVDKYGTIDLIQLAEAVRPDTLVVSVMAANNEIGTLAPVRQVAEIAHTVGALFHCDATQAVGKVPFHVESVGADLVSLSAHKFYGPKGTGALYVRRSVTAKLRPVIDGGGQERGLRSGTLNVPGCVGLGSAAAIASNEMAGDVPRLRDLADRLRERVTGTVAGVSVVGHPTERLPGNISLAFSGMDAEDLMLSMPDLAVSTGSACSVASPAPSHVLLALGLGYLEAQSVLRFGAGRFTTIAEIDTAAERVADAVMHRRLEVNALAGPPARP
jgi:cysteine desulfurase